MENATLSGPPRLIPARAGKTARSGARGRRRRAHPRACGENNGACMAAQSCQGSSPRVRGKPSPPRGVRPVRGLIPARAGKTICGLHRGRASGAHPRACGENVGGRPRVLRLQGSSPRVRGKRALGDAGRVPCLAHPRACGENSRRRARRARGRGSSPRVRGKLRFGSPRTRRPGLIPARAGKTIRGVRQDHHRPAHPRACGENQQRKPFYTRWWGSSPRVRGKLTDWSEGRPCRGLIPARAGKTGSCSASWPRRWAHPRACGENHLVESMRSGNPGSSPRVRGKLGGGRRHRHRRRLIPARAGKTRPRRGGLSGAWAHPRACGENRPFRPSAASLAGSSPRVRGKRRGPCARLPDRRLIPARAGKTGMTLMTRIASAAHPRACGENIVSPVCLRSWNGSSPRVRGKQRRRQPPRGRRGLIPARAGKTPKAVAAHVDMRAHPRACGENPESRGGPCGHEGSSPRVRGKRQSCPPHSYAAGLIPARAGKTATRTPDPGPMGAHPRACGENA